MKKSIFATLCLTLAIMFSGNMNAQNKGIGTDEAIKNLKPYPVILDSLERHVIFLDQQENEDLYKVELIAGKNMEVDCNRHKLMGGFAEGNVEGWGFGYYTFETNGNIMSTMMACPNPKTMKFVSGESMLVRYNSRLPLVIYLPKDMNLKYKIWTAGEEQFVTK